MILSPHSALASEPPDICRTSASRPKPVGHAGGTDGTKANCALARAMGITMKTGREVAVAEETVDSGQPPLARRSRVGVISSALSAKWTVLTSNLGFCDWLVVSVGWRVGMKGR